MARNENESALDVRGLRVAYGEREALRDVDLKVAAGEVVGLVGPNGCGKTTLLKAVTRGVRAQSGEIAVAGEDVAGLVQRELARRIAVVPQNPTLPVGFLAREIVVMGRTPYLRFLEQESVQDYVLADAALASLGAESIAHRRVEELSGGERQNVVLARALVQETPLLLLDEPTANLDVGHQVTIARLVKELARERGVAVLAALHDLTLASLHCDRLVLLTAGRVIADGAPRDVLTADNLRVAYGSDVLVLQPEGIAAPVVLPLDPARTEARQTCPQP